MNIEAYRQAKKNADKEFAACKAKNIDPYLPVLDELTQELNIVSRPSLGIVSIPIEQIEGTVSNNRSNAFSRSFYPLLDVGTEFSNKWAILYESVEEIGVNDPIIAFEYMNRFYVREGNKRVSVSKCIGTVSIEGNVTRLIPARDGSFEVDNYYDFMDFYAKSGINEIYFTKPGYFTRFCGMVNEDDKWSEDTVMDVRSLFARFKKEYIAKGGEKLPFTISDAFFIFVSFLGYNEVKDASGTEIKDYLGKMWKEYITESQDTPIAISDKPTDEKPAGIKAMFSGEKNLHVAFMHLGNIENSAWVYAHELGKHYLESIYDSSMTFTSFFDVSIEDAEEKLEELCHRGYDVIFATSPQHNAACAKVAILHPEVKILNCSLNVSTKHVRTYYLRTYESKYLLGIIAGAMTKTNHIAYIADYPVYGSVASINAFAIGAKTVNPNAEIFLSWTSVKNSDPQRLIKEAGCDIVSNLDWSSPKLLTRKFGLYMNEANPVNLAAPLWDWGKLYEAIIKSIKKGSWKIEEANAGAQSLEYWWGVSSGAVDIIYSKKIPALTFKLVNYIRKQIKAGRYMPFYGQLYFQNGRFFDAGNGMDFKDLINMNYLYENVHGYIPGVEDVKEETVELTKVQGVIDNGKG